MNTSAQKTSLKTPLLLAAERAETLAQLVEEGVDVVSELTTELVDQINNDVADAIDRRFMLIKGLESQIESIKGIREQLTQSIKRREHVIDSVMESTKKVMQMYPNLKMQGSLCRASLRKNPPALQVSIPLKSKSVSNMIDLPEENIGASLRPYVKKVEVLTLDTALLKEHALVENYEWAKVTRGESVQFRGV